MSKQRRIVLLSAGIPLGLLLLLVAAWGIDATISGDQVMRQVSMDDVSLDGLQRDDLRALAADLNQDLGSETVVVEVGDAEVELDPVALGVRIDPERLAEEALRARRDGFFLVRPFRWMASFFSVHELDPPYRVDEQQAAEATAQLVESVLASPTEPALAVAEGAITISPGSEGATLDDGQLAAALPAMMASGAPYALALTPRPLSPTIDTADLETVAADANARTGRGVTIQVLGDQASIGAEQLRSWVILAPPEGSTSEAEGEPPPWTIDEARMLAELVPAFPSLGGSDKQARFEIVDNRPVVIPSAESLVCCLEGSAAKLAGVLRAAPPFDPDDEQSEAEPMPSVELEPIITGGDGAAAALEALGIVEEVATFTTRHSCCENRVTNIHLMADVVRGTVVRPGETFSLNGLVGERTEAGGFLPAGAIAQGVLEPQIGGGVSQFTTTIFNAAFFAGMELVEYQSHSLYFSRYPRGREATISWPKPHFKFRNDTPYGILIWPTYDDTSITVTFYSTKHITVEDVGRTESAQGMCTRVTTTRQRTWADGRTDSDSVFAVYRPSEGLDCKGNPTAPATSGTTVPPVGSTTVPGGAGATATTTPPTTTVAPTTTTS